MESAADLLPEERATTLFIGHHETQRTSSISDELLAQVEEYGYDFVTTPITTAAFRSRVLKLSREYVEDSAQHSDASLRPLPLISPLTPEDTTFTPAASNTSRMGTISPWIDLGSRDPMIAHVSRQVLNLQIAYAAFCGINNIIVHGPIEGADTVQYARAIQEALGLGPYLQLHVLIPMTGELEMEETGGTHLAELVSPDVQDVDEDPDAIHGAWETWNTIRLMCSYSNRLSLALELPRQLPPLHLQQRWYSEPVRFLSFPRTTFLRNAKGYPVLSKPHQQYISLFVRLRFPPWMLLVDVGALRLNSSDTNEGHSSEPTPAQAASRSHEKPKDPAPHLRYLRHLQETQPPRPAIERFGQGYQDYLQSPLQPLTDNLESVTYEVFEKDPVKYEWYERAIAAALQDLSSILGKERRITVAIVGAGRGPLVTRALQASRSTGLSIDCWAVEKNPNAFVLLQQRNATDPLWNNEVHVVKSDMRHWTGPTSSNGNDKVEVMVSELLGSFADNELSPECLDGVQHVLHSDHGVNIPQRYSAHMTPIATPRLYSDLLGRTGQEKWDIPYVVMLHQYDYLCVAEESTESQTPDVKQTWSFSHPIPQQHIEHIRLRAGGGAGAGGWVGGDGSNEHNARSSKLTFQCRRPGVCHGLAGYFETVLYDGKYRKIELSTNPVTMEKKSKDMISWFPIFFPLKTPVFVPEHSELVVYMWRQTDDRSVWYEWLVEVWDNAGARRKVAMSELHSSRRNACLM